MTDTSQLLAMSDEDFLKMGVPPAAEENQEGNDPGATPDPVVEEPKAEAPVEEPAVAPTQVEAGKVDEEEPDEPAAKTEEGTAPASLAPAAATDDKGEAPKVAESQAPSVNYEDFYKQIMTPFKANGRMVEPRTPEEAIRLMQMGAGFGRKMQDMQPHLKTIRMLEKNGLLDETELSFLIDIKNKNPEAIKKIIKDSGIDPLDLNIEDNINYTPHNHSVSDAEVSFQEALSELQAQPTGTETLKVINQTWDEKSKGLLWESPELIGVIQTQREAGIYDRIVAEMERQKIFGTIPATMPFLEAYKTAGDALVASGGIPAAPSAQPTPAQPQVVATRVDAPKPAVKHNDKAAAATPTPSSGRKAASFVNPLNMSDDEFLKQFSGRL